MGSRKDKTAADSALTESDEARGVKGDAGNTTASAELESDGMIPAGVEPAGPVLADEPGPDEPEPADKPDPDELESTDKPGRKFTRRRFVLGAAVAGGVVAVGAVGTAGTLLLYGQSESVRGTEEAPAEDSASNKPATATKLPDAAAPQAAGAKTADETADKNSDAGDAVQGNPSVEDNAGDGLDGVDASSGGVDGGDASNDGAVDGDAPNDSTDDDPVGGSPNPSGNTGSERPSGSDSANDAPKKKWHEGWNEWVVDTPGHWEVTVVKHDAVYYDKPVYGGKCQECSFTFTDYYLQWVPHSEATGHRGYDTGVQIGTERELVEAAWDEEVKTWIDEEGHNVWHDGYWE
jgi:hypothetical protein